MVTKNASSVKIKPVDPMGFISANIFWLRWTGQWFHDHAFGSFQYWRSLFIKHLFLFIAYTLPVAGEMYYLYHNHNDVEKLAECLYLTLSEVFCPAKLAIFTYNKRIILEMIGDLSGEAFRPTEPEHADIIRAAMSKGRALTFFFSWMCFTSVSVGCFIPIAENFQVLPTDNIQYPYVDKMTTPAYQLIYFMEVLYKPTGVIMYCAVETLPSLFMSCAIAQLEILTFNLENLDELVNRAFERLGLRADAGNKEDKDRVMHDILRRCIKHHSIVVNFVHKVEKAYALQMGMQFLLSALVICLTGVQFFSIDDPIHKPLQLLWMVMYLCEMVLAVYMVCYFGNELMWKSEHLTTAAYNSPWMSMTEEMKGSLIIFRERCRRPLSVRAAKFFDISLVTFTSLMKWAFNAFAVMNQMT